jgi:hypothetical protein
MAWNMCVENGVVKYLVMNLFATTAAAMHTLADTAAAAAAASIR